ncbi:type II toxin-antitoxin system VapC family toxin [Lentisphaera marina]|uniref:type II toxin-antitoxin system VapC family toxin n=1 Tax=Lentisphaera marina TaxID=1111041 RepID=UPI002365835E|nr:type II toxin-antitoxin system VapC family toxin [Lentisphaera marina]MDD7985760.1 type II toxin-antitoxin system VapC family toxin [Lentisphaera marina]
MNILLDTHAFIWFGTNRMDKLSELAITSFLDLNNEIYLSKASIWEMAIKINIGKLHLQKPLESLISSAIKNNIKILDIELNYILNYQNLKLHHNDPFDRLIISSASSEKMKIISCDEKFLLYKEVDIIW